MSHFSEEIKLEKLRNNFVFFYRWTRFWFMHLVCTLLSSSSHCYPNLPSMRPLKSFSLLHTFQCHYPHSFMSCTCLSHMEPHFSPPPLSIFGTVYGMSYIAYFNASLFIISFAAFHTTNCIEDAPVVWVSAYGNFLLSRA